MNIVNEALNLDFIYKNLKIVPNANALFNNRLRFSLRFIKRYGDFADCSEKIYNNRAEIIEDIKCNAAVFFLDIINQKEKLKIINNGPDDNTKTYIKEHIFHNIVVRNILNFIVENSTSANPRLTKEYVFLKKYDHGKTKIDQIENLMIELFIYIKSFKEESHRINIMNILKYIANDKKKGIK